MMKHMNWFLSLSIAACMVGIAVPAALADVAGNSEAEAVSTASLPIKNRIDAYRALAAKINADKKADKNIILNKGLELMAAPELTDPAQRTQVRQILLDNARKYNKVLLEKIAGEILADPAAPFAQKLAANNDLVNLELAKNNVDAAGKQANQPLSWENLTSANKAEIYKNIASMKSTIGDCDAAVASYRKMAELNPDNQTIRNAMVSHIAQVYKEFLRYDDAEKTYQQAGRYLDAANMWNSLGFKKKAMDNAIKILSNKAETPAQRQAAWLIFSGSSEAERAVRKQYTAEIFPDGGKINFGALRNIAWQQMYDGNYTDVQDIFDIINKSGNDKDKSKAEIINWQLTSLGGLGEFQKAASIAEKYSNFADWDAKQRYQTLLNKILFTEKDGAFAQAWKTADAQAGKDLSIQDKVNVLIYIGRNAMIARKYESARQIEQIRDSFYVPEPQKTTTVKYSPKRIHGIDDFPALDPATAQRLDRKYGGNMDFLVTDVATGNRGTGIGDGNKENQHVPTIFNVYYDDTGVHFLFRAYDKQAREVEAMLLGAGSYEIYLAPGINQPYYCILPNLQNGTCGIFQTTYNTEEHQRITENNGGYRQEHRFLDDGYLTYFFLDWKFMFNKLPDTGDVWEFENIHWGRDGGYGWNGTKTIHGRSTWGHLVFQMEPEALVKIKRRIIFSALQNYKQELKTNAKLHGIISLMQDKVLGDPDFYQAKVKPLQDFLAPYEALVK